MKPVIVCTDKRGVIFGYAKQDRPNKLEQITLKKLVCAKAAELHGMDSVPAFIRSTAIRAARDIVGE